MDGFQVFGRHDILVVHIQFHIRLLITHRVRATAHLHAGTPVGRVVHLVQRKIAFSRHCHTESTVTEHFDTNRLSAGTTDILLADMTINLRYLFQIQLACQYHNIGKLCVEAQGLHIRDIQLRTEMYLLTDLPRIAHHSYVRRNHRRDTRRLGRIYDGAHQCQILIVNNSVNGKITLHIVLIARLRYFPKVFNSECISRTGPHIQVFNTEIDGIGTCLDGRHK